MSRATQATNRFPAIRETAGTPAGHSENEKCDRLATAARSAAGALAIDEGFERARVWLPAASVVA
jgi:hypothetical protein